MSDESYYKIIRAFNLSTLVAAVDLFFETERGSEWRALGAPFHTGNEWHQAVTRR